MISPSPFPSWLTRSFRKEAVLLVSLSIFSPLGMAATIVDWGGNYVTENTNLETGSTQATGGGKTLTYLYSATSPKSPSSGYTAPVDKSGQFYGAFQVERDSGTASFTTYAIVDKGANDWLHVTGVTETATGTTRSLTGLVFFKKEDFLDGANAANLAVKLDAMSSINVTIANVPTATREVRAAVYANIGGTWNWYLSSAVYTGGAGSFSLTELGTTNWSLWDITSTTAPLNPAPQNYDVSGANFDDIGAVGMYFSVAPRSTTTTPPGIAFSAISFDASVVPIPEPSVTALLLLPLIGGASWYFAKEKKSQLH